MSKQVKYTITVDALRILFRGGSTNVVNYHEPQNYITVTDELVLRRSNSESHPAFSLCYYVEYRQQVFGKFYLFENGTYNYKHKDVLLFTINNNILYQNRYSARIHDIAKLFNLTFYEYEYMEIAIDGIGLIVKLNKLLTSRIYKLKRNVTVKPEFDVVTKRHKRYHLGSEKSDKYVSLYPKGLEIEASGKYYISDYWCRNKLSDDIHTIERCEVRLKAKALRSFTDDYNMLEDGGYLASFFRQSAGSYFHFVHATSKHAKHLIDWKQFPKAVVNKAAFVQPTCSVYLYKTTIKTLFLEYYKTAQSQVVFVLATLAVTYNLTGWLYKSMQRWISEM